MSYNSTPWFGYTFVSIFIAFIIHVVFGFILGFSVDEAHYALYGLYLDWSYFDHPPLVGWMQAIPVHLHLTDGWIRLIPEFFWLAGVLLSMRIAALLLERHRSSFPYLKERAVMFWTALIAILAPLLHVLGVGLLPDTLLLFLVPCMMLITLRLDEQLHNRHPQDLGLWMLLGLILGLAGLYGALFCYLCAYLPDHLAWI